MVPGVAHQVAASSTIPIGLVRGKEHKIPPPHEPPLSVNSIVIASEAKQFNSEFTERGKRSPMFINFPFVGAHVASAGARKEEQCVRCSS